jgi:hypothetical protein
MTPAELERELLGIAAVLGLHPSDFVELVLTHPSVEQVANMSLGEVANIAMRAGSNAMKGSGCDCQGGRGYSAIAGPGAGSVTEPQGQAGGSIFGDLVGLVSSDAGDAINVVTDPFSFAEKWVKKKVVKAGLDAAGIDTGKVGELVLGKGQRGSGQAFWEEVGSGLLAGVTLGQVKVGPAKKHADQLAWLPFGDKGFAAEAGIKPSTVVGAVGAVYKPAAPVAAGLAMLGAGAPPFERYSGTQLSGLYNSQGEQLGYGATDTTSRGTIGIGPVGGQNGGNWFFKEPTTGAFDKNLFKYFPVDRQNGGSWMSSAHQPGTRWTAEEIAQATKDANTLKAHMHRRHQQGGTGFYEDAKAYAKKHGKTIAKGAAAAAAAAAAAGAAYLKSQSGKEETCESLLSSKGIASTRDWRKWSARGGHPDKGGDTETYQKVTSCKEDLYGRGMKGDGIVGDIGSFAKRNAGKLATGTAAAIAAGLAYMDAQKDESTPTRDNSWMTDTSHQTALNQASRMGGYTRNRGALGKTASKSGKMADSAQSFGSLAEQLRRQQQGRGVMTDIRDDIADLADSAVKEAMKQMIKYSGVTRDDTKLTQFLKGFAMPYRAVIDVGKFAHKKGKELGIKPSDIASIAGHPKVAENLKLVGQGNDSCCEQTGFGKSFWDQAKEAGAGALAGATLGAVKVGAAKENADLLRWLPFGDKGFATELGVKPSDVASALGSVYKPAEAYAKPIASGLKTIGMGGRGTIGTAPVHHNINEHAASASNWRPNTVTRGVSEGLHGFRGMGATGAKGITHWGLATDGDYRTPSGYPSF